MHLASRAVSGFLGLAALTAQVGAGPLTPIFFDLEVLRQDRDLVECRVGQDQCTPSQGWVVHPMQIVATPESICRTRQRFVPPEGIFEFEACSLEADQFRIAVWSAEGLTAETVSGLQLSGLIRASLPIDPELDKAIDLGQASSPDQLSWSSASPAEPKIRITALVPHGEPGFLREASGYVAMGDFTPDWSPHQGECMNLGTFATLCRSAAVVLEVSGEGSDNPESFLASIDWNSRTWRTTIPGPLPTRLRVRLMNLDPLGMQPLDGSEPNE